ncbi:MAG: type II secretion system F family protein, partial [Gammaproteobacteria bacterium]|nr:type II secretion system F family protein [Gammaproteobacteria bacterium]
MAVAAPKAEKAEIFAWEGSDKRGKRIKGESRAASMALVRADLRRQGINPIKVTKKSALFRARKKKIRPGDIAVFSRQLATMMSSGVPLVQAFDIVGRGHDNPSMQDLILSIKADVEGGTALAEALKKHPLYFDDLFCNLVHAGEQAGVLEELLHKIATYKEKTESLKGKIKKAMFYPAAVIIVAVLVTSIIMIFVIPQFQELFSSFGSDLPAFTQVVVAMSEWMQEWWWLLLLSVIATVYIFGYIWKRSRKFRHTVDKMLLKTPIIGVIVNKAALARFARTLSTMFAAGVPLVEALESVSGATGNVVYGEAVLRMREDVATGQSLQLAMKQQNLFPHMVIQMVAIGEESGSI